MLRALALKSLHGESLAFGAPSPPLSLSLPHKGGGNRGARTFATHAVHSRIASRDVFMPWRLRRDDNENQSYVFAVRCKYASAARSRRGSSAQKPNALLQLRQSSPRTRPVTWQ
jgi:hypothetical protein